MDGAVLFWVLFLALTLWPGLQRRLIEHARLQRLRALERERGTRVITLIHRQEVMNILGLPLARYISIEDSEAVLQAIRLTPPDAPLDLVMHTPGGLVLASEQIAQALRRRPGRTTILVPHYAMSGGTLIALAADEIVMDENAVLGPVDPQVGEYPAVSILAATSQPNPNRDDRTLILADVAAKAIRQVRETVAGLVRGRYPDEVAERIVETLTEGRWTHDYPIDVQQAREMGLRVSTEIPVSVYDLMQLYPQPGQRRPSVEYVPIPYHRPEGGRQPPASRPVPRRGWWQD
ncbi:MAG: hypothetical protein HY320_13115 [Armatimonadetes bacterium]|nr:hypothetical protein [Armatimonadota bacterium]